MEDDIQWNNFETGYSALSQCYDQHDTVIIGGCFPKFQNNKILQIEKEEYDVSWITFWNIPFEEKTSHIPCGDFTKYMKCDGPNKWVTSIWLWDLRV